MIFLIFKVQNNIEDGTERHPRHHWIKFEFDFEVEAIGNFSLLEKRDLVRRQRFYCIYNPRVDNNDIGMMIIFTNINEKRWSTESFIDAVMQMEST